GGRADERDVVPGERGEGAGQLLEPAFVGEAAVVGRRVGAEDQLQAGGGRRGWLSERVGGPVRAGRDAARRERGVGDQAVVERGAPEGVEVAAGVAALPERLDQVVAGAVRLVGEGGQQLVGGARLVERGDQRLHDGGGAV